MMRLWHGGTEAQHRSNPDQVSGVPVTSQIEADRSSVACDLENGDTRTSVKTAE